MLFQSLDSLSGYFIVSDRQVWAYSEDPDQNASELGPTLVAFRSASFGHIAVW